MIKKIQLAVVLFVYTLNPAVAAPCVDQSYRMSFDIQSLKNEMMLISVTCDRTDLYNSVMIRFHDEFIEQDRTINQWFKKSYGRGAVYKHDQYITSLANQTSQLNRHELEYCDSEKGTALLDNLQNLKGVPELRAYASMVGSKQPPEVKWCKN